MHCNAEIVCLNGKSKCTITEKISNISVLDISASYRHQCTIRKKAMSFVIEFEMKCIHFLWYTLILNKS